MGIHKTEAIVLKREDFRETSVIAHFYTKDFGKVSGLLKGVREEPAKIASTIEPFSHNEIIFYRKRNSSLHIVSQCDMKYNFDSIRSHMVKVGLATMMMELLSGVMAQEDANEEAFNLTLDSLRELESNNNTDKIITIFKIKILALSGFKPNFDSCVVCGQRAVGDFKFSLSLGGLLCSRCYKKDLRARSIFRGTVASILHIEKNNFKSNLTLGMNPQIKRELEAILNSFLNFHLERELKSQKVVEHLESVSRAMPKKAQEIGL